MIASPNSNRVIKSRRRWAGHVACMGGRIGACRDLVGSPDGMRPLGRPRLNWKDKITMYFLEVELEAKTGLIWLRRGSGGGRL